MKRDFHLCSLEYIVFKSKYNSLNPSEFNKIPSIKRKLRVISNFEIGDLVSEWNSGLASLENSTEFTNSVAFTLTSN